MSLSTSEYTQNVAGIFLPGDPVLGPAPISISTRTHYEVQPVTSLGPTAWIGKPPSLWLSLLGMWPGEGLVLSTSHFLLCKTKSVMVPTSYSQQGNQKESTAPGMLGVWEGLMGTITVIICLPFLTPEPLESCLHLLSGSWFSANWWWLLLAI